MTLPPDRATSGATFAIIASQTAKAEPIKNAIAEHLRQMGLKEVESRAGSIKNSVEREWARLKTADVVIADLSDFHPNVLFEIGLAAGLQKEILLIKEISEKRSLPDELSQYMVLTYVKDHIDDFIANIGLGVAIILLGNSLRDLKGGKT